MIDDKRRDETASPASRNHPVSIATDFTIPPAEICCESVDLVETGRGEIVCKNCGLVHGREIKSQARAAYTMEEIDKRLTNAPIIKMKPVIVIPRSGRHAVKDPEMWTRLACLNSRRADRLQQGYCNKVRADCRSLELPWHVAETAVRIFSGCIKAGRLRGRSVAGMSKASIYYACVVNHISMPVKILLGDTMSRDKVMTSMKFAKQSADKLYGKKDAGDKISRRSDRIARFCNEIEIAANRACMNNMECASAAKEIYAKIAVEKEGMMFDGKSPGTIIAALLYITGRVMGSHLIVARNGKVEQRYATQKWIAEATSKVTEVSLRNRSKEIVIAAMRIEKRTGKPVHPVIGEFAGKFKIKIP